MNEITYINIDSLVADPSQPRQEFDSLHMNQLVKSIAQKGVLNPLVVESLEGGMYLLVDGERRFRASRQAGLEKIPARIVGKMSAVDRLILRFHLQENSKPWNSFEKAKAIKTLTDDYNYTNEVLADMIGITQGQLKHFKLLLMLRPATREAVEQRRITSRLAIGIANISANLREQKLHKYTERLEEALTSKAERGIIKTLNDTKAMRDAIIQAGERIVENIIKVKDYTPEKALVDSKAGEIAAYKKLINSMTWIEAGMNKAIENSLFTLLDNHGHATIKRAVKKLNKFLELADYQGE